MAKRVEVLVFEDTGEIHVVGQDFHGPECDSIIDDITDGLRVKSEKKLRSYYEKPQKERRKVTS